MDAKVNVPAPIAQGEDEEAAANSSADVMVAGAEAHIYSPAMVVQPVVAPKVNIFGELDGQQPKSSAGRADFGFQQHTYSDEGYDGEVHIDPTGKWLVFSSTRHHVKPEIYVQRVDRTSVTQFHVPVARVACATPDRPNASTAGATLPSGLQ